MSLKTSRIFGILAAALYGLALIVSLLTILFRVPILRLYHAPEEMYAAAGIPVNTIVRCAVFFLVILLYAILILALKPSRGGSIAIAVVFAAVLLLLNGVLFPLLSTASTLFVGYRMGAMSLAGNSVMETGASFLTSFFTTPAFLLALISMGGYWGKTAAQK